MGPGSAAAPQKRCAASRARERSVAHILSTSSLRAQRLVRRSFSEGGSNPESLRGGRLDCFAALAMTEQGASILILQMQARLADAASRSRGAFRPSFAWSLHPLVQEGAGKAGCGWHPRSAARKAHAENRTAAYLALTEVPTPSRLTRMPHPQELDRSNDGQDNTVLPHAGLAISPQFFQPCRRSRKLTDETKPSSAARRNEASGSRRAIRPALGLSYPNAAASTASPAREHDDHKIAPQG